MVSNFPIDIRKPTLTPYGRKTFVLFDSSDGAAEIICKVKKRKYFKIIGLWFE